jgi:hypothetical protein
MKLIPIFYLGLTMLSAMPDQKYGPISETEVIRMLTNPSSIQERYQGFRRAERIDSEAVNVVLVCLLDSKVGGGMVMDIGLLPIWIQSLAILAERFPEAGIKSPVTNDRAQVIKFKDWWGRNRERIVYHGKSHSLTPVPYASDRAKIDPLEAGSALPPSEGLVRDLRDKPDRIGFRSSPPKSQDVTVKSSRTNQGDLSVSVFIMVAMVMVGVIVGLGVYGRRRK